MADEADDSHPNDAYYQRNMAWAKKADSYQTKLSSQEEGAFQQWVKDNNVPFEDHPKADYDMRGFWKALRSGDPKARSAIDPNDNRLHYPDYWKTPYHQSFSAESQWAAKGAPRWNARDQLVTPDGKVLYDDRAPKPIHPAVKQALLLEKP